MASRATPLILLLLVSSLAVPRRAAAGGDQGTELTDQEKDLFVQYAPQWGRIRAEYVQKKDYYRQHPGELEALVVKEIPDPRAQKPFYHLVVQQLMGPPEPGAVSPQPATPSGGNPAAVVAPDRTTGPEATTGGAGAGPGGPGGAQGSQGPSGAEQYLRQFINQHPDAAWARLASARAAYDRGDYQTARSGYLSALELDPKDMKALLGFADSSFKLRDYASAARSAMKVLDGDPKNGDALYIYHTAREKLPASAAPEVPNALSASPRSAASAPAEGPASGAPAASPAPAASGPDAVERSAQLTKDAVNALKVRDAQTAYSLANQAVALNPQNAQALNFRAMALTQMSRYSDATRDASAALALAPGSAAVLQTRSWAFSKQGKYKEGLEDAEATLERDPQNAFAYQNLAFARAGLRDRDGALDALRQAAAIDARFQNKLERALQLPKDQDLSVLFDDGAASAAAAAPARAPGSRERRFLRLALLSAVGGLLIALGVLHVVSASWRDRLRATVRRALGSSVGAAGPAVGAADPAAGADEAPSGAFWAQYELVKEIGLGGMGVVYEATDRALERRVAVKKMRDEIRLDPDERRRFVAEARTVAQLHHPNIVDVYGIVEDAGDVYLVFEFIDGRTLGDALKSGGPMDLSRARRVLGEMGAAVAHAHERGVIHRDLKPSNVMLTADDRVKVMDFGIARQAKDAMTRRSMTNTIAGTPPYMAPEQEQGAVRREADVYALGVCLYEMLTGHLPFAGSSAAMLLNKLNGKFVPASQRAPSLPPALDAVIARALAPDPDKRFRGPAELLAALDALPVARAA